MVPLSPVIKQMINETLYDVDTKMKKAVDILTRELASLRTGRATPSLVEHIKVDYHGIPTPLSQLASITIPEARLILIQPWDRSSIHNIEKAILKSDLSLNPTSDGNVIRIPIPPLSEERRRELVKVVRKRAEEGRVALRNLRREGLERLRELEKNKQISHDEYSRASEQLQRLTDAFIEKVNEISRDKEAETMEA